MTDESRAPEPQPPSGRSTDVESVANISAVLSAVAVAAVAAVIGVVIGVGVIVVSAVLSAVVSPAAFITFIGKAVRGVSRLRLALRQMRVAAPFALAVWIGGRGRRWQAEDWLVALAESPRPIRYSLGLVSAATRMRLYDLSGLLVKAARWMLATDTRTWTPLTGLLLWGGTETTLDTGLGAAILAVIGSGAVFQTGVTWGRNRLGVEAQQRKSIE